MHATTVAVDLAKSVFQLVVADEHWRIMETQRLSRSRLGVSLSLRLNINPIALFWRPAITSMDSIEKGSNDLRGQCFVSTRHAEPSKVHVRCSINDPQPLAACRHVHIRLGTRLPRGAAKFVIASPCERQHRTLYICPGVLRKYRPSSLRRQSNVCTE